MQEQPQTDHRIDNISQRVAVDDPPQFPDHTMGNLKYSKI